MPQINQKIRLSDNLSEQVRKQAATERRTIHNMITLLIEQGLNQRKRYTFEDRTSIERTIDNA